MSKNYASSLSKPSVPQTKRSDPRQIKNDAGGYVFEANPFTTLNRFLVIGTEGGTFYASEKKQTRRATSNTLACIRQDGKKVVDMVVEVSRNGRAVSNDTALFVLALCASTNDPEVRKYALSVLPSVARIGKHWLYFLSQIDSKNADGSKVMRGWGRALRKAMSVLYTRLTPENLAYQVTKYYNRDGYTQHDFMRLVHPVPSSEQANLFKWIAGKYEGAVNSLPKSARGYEIAKRATTEKEVIAAIKEYDLTHEMIPTAFLKSKKVWQALLEKMPLEAMLRNLGRMSSLGMTENFSNEIGVILGRLSDKEYIHASRLHPMKIFVGAKTYASGRGDKGSLTWKVNHQILNALNEAFYLAFNNVAPFGKKVLYAIDWSGSMGASVAGLASTSCKEASVALTLAHLASHGGEFNKSGGQFGVVGFTSGTTIKEVPLTAKTRISEAESMIDRIVGSGGTDLSLPVQYLLDKNMFVDGLVLFTDSETWAGNRHVTEVLKQYRSKINPNFRFVVESIQFNNVRLADPEDALSLDIVGFDVSSPQIASEFIMGDM